MIGTQFHARCHGGVSPLGRRARAPALCLAAAACALAAASCGTSQPRRVDRSSGCGVSGQPTGSVMPQSITVAGAARTYALTVPAGYVPTVPSTLIFGYHGSGGTGAGFAGYLGLEAASGSPAIFVYPDGAGGVWDTSAGGADVQMFDAVAAAVESRYCIDRNRVFAAGFSYGGSMTNTLGCFRGSAVRAIAPIAGGILFPADAACQRALPVWLSYGSSDPYFPQYGAANRDFWLARDGCGSASVPVDPAPCRAYSGCGSGGGMTYCEWNGGHDIPPFGPQAIRAFFDAAP